MPTAPVLDVSAAVAGLVACALAVFLSTVLVFLLYRTNTWLTTRTDAERLLLAGHRSSAVCLGAMLLSQAWLLRHAVFPIMVMVRGLFVQSFSWGALLLVVGRSLVVLAVLGALSSGSVVVAAWLFTRLTGAIPEREEILKDNVAVAILFAFALLSITAILSEGVEDLSRSLIPYASSGVLNLQ